jgi:hypothetical protein
MQRDCLRRKVDALADENGRLLDVCNQPLHVRGGKREGGRGRGHGASADAGADAGADADANAG